MGKTSLSKWPFYANAVLGALYTIIGFLYLILGFGYTFSLPGSSDMISSLMLVIVGSVYLTGLKPLRDRQFEGYAYTLVASGLAAVLFALHLIVIGTNALGRLLAFDDWINWSPLDDFSPAIWLFFVILIAAAYLKLTGRIPIENKMMHAGG
ncbi:MAG: hypothetical protein ACFFEF_03260 [Candidatus Thorarchaeota archaeon]